MSNTCGCQNSGNAEFAEVAPVLEKYAKVPGSLITILQQTQDIYGYLSLDAIKLHLGKNRYHAGEDLWCRYILCSVPFTACRQVPDHALQRYSLSCKRL